MTLVIETKTLPCALTAAEVATRADELSVCLGKLETLDEERRAMLSAFKERTDMLASAVKRLAGIVRTRSEDRPVACSVHYDEKAFVVEWVRTDTNEVVAQRPMSSDEAIEAAQQTLPGMAKARRPRGKAKLIPIAPDAEQPTTDEPT
jgi:hypothetical protein